MYILYMVCWNMFMMSLTSGLTDLTVIFPALDSCICYQYCLRWLFKFRKLSLQVLSVFPLHMFWKNMVVDIVRTSLFFLSIISPKKSWFRLKNLKMMKSEKESHHSQETDFLGEPCSNFRGCTPVEDEKAHALVCLFLLLCKWPVCVGSPNPHVQAQLPEDVSQVSRKCCQSNVPRIERFFSKGGT